MERLPLGGRFSFLGEWGVGFRKSLLLCKFPLAAPSQGYTHLKN
jgi:hypothetical protein